MNNTKKGYIKNKLHRQLVLLSFLLKSKYHNRNDLMRQMGYGSERSMERDLKTLKDAGIISAEYTLTSSERYSDLGGESIDEGYNYNIQILDYNEYPESQDAHIIRLQRLSRMIIEFPNHRFDSIYPYYYLIQDKYNELFPNTAMNTRESDFNDLAIISNWIELDSDLFWTSKEASELPRFPSIDVINGKGQLLTDETVIFDIETTGFSARRDNIILIRAVKIREGKVLGKFMEYINPGYRISDRVQKLTGIDAERLELSSETPTVINRFLDFAGDSILATNAASFQYAFIKSNCEQYDLPMDNTVVDFSQLIRIIILGIQKTTIGAISDALGIDSGEIADESILMALIYSQMTSRLSERGITSISQLEHIRFE